MRDDGKTYAEWALAPHAQVLAKGSKEQPAPQLSLMNDGNARIRRIVQKAQQCKRVQLSFTAGR